MNSQFEEKRMRQLLDEFIERKAEENQFYRSTVGMRPQPGPPASPHELQKLNDYLASGGLHSPEAYTRFLRVYNGVEMLLYPLSLYSISEVIGKHDIIESMFDERPGCRHFIIGGSPRTGDKIAFDVNKPTPNGGYEIVWLLEQGGEEEEPVTSDFENFLRKYLEVTKQTIAMELENRNSFNQTQ